MPESCVVIATFTPQPGHREAVREALLEAIPRVHQEDGCELYALHEDVEDRFVLIEKWTTREAWRVHAGLPAVATLQASLQGLLVGEAEVCEMYNTPCGTPEQGTL